MKVLTVSSGNYFILNPGIKEQGDSLQEYSIEVEHFTIKGKGLTGYLKNVKILKKRLQYNRYDVIHAHYSLSAIVAVLAGARPLVVSLMGSDVQASFAWKLIIKFFCCFSWDFVIVKSKIMAKKLNLKEYHVIPNGINFTRFENTQKEKAKDMVGLQSDKQYVLFVGYKRRKEKNFKLAEQAFHILKKKYRGKMGIELLVLENTDFRLIPTYMYAADVLLLTSFWEGSPNVVKEAMAANLPIVATDVGDVREMIGKTRGCFLTSFEPKDVAEKLKMALSFGDRTKGREYVAHLDVKEIAKRVAVIYEKAISKNTAKFNRIQ